MPGLIVEVEFPDSETAAFDVSPDVLGAGRPASGSATNGVPVTGVDFSHALPLACTPPTTRIDPAFTLAFPLACPADDELESTSTRPGTVRVAFPDRLNAPDCVRLSTYTEPMFHV